MNTHNTTTTTPNRTINMPPHTQDIAIVMVPFPAQGHLNQLLHLSRLLLPYNIPIHYLAAASHNRQANLRVHGWSPLTTPNIHFHDLQIPPFQTPSPDPNSPTNFPAHLQPCFDAAKHLYFPVTALLTSLSSCTRRTIVIHDSLMGSVIRAAHLLPNIDTYCFQSVSAFSIFLYIWETMEGNVIQTNDVLPEEIPSLDDCFTPEFMDSIANEYHHQRVSSGYIFNTNRVIEEPYLKLIEQSTMDTNIKHFSLGPFNPIEVDKKGNSRHECLEWLDKQSLNSVIYVSFGTTTAMSDEQINELATGLKQSNQKFIWVLRDADKGDIFKDPVKKYYKLPEGYEESIKEKGLIVRDWAPQLEILGHESTGGFISHCGWNSCMESITMGVPMGAWPMHSDQPRNTVLITQLLKVGIVVRDWSRRSEIVTADCVENVVRRLMVSKEGEEMRNRAREFGRKVRESVDEGGSSRLELDSFVAHITRVC